MNAPFAEPSSHSRHKDSLGCSLSELRVDQVLSTQDMVFRRKAAEGRHRSHVDTPAQDRGLLVGVSLVDGHRRTGHTRGGRRDRIFDSGDIYIRDFDENYSADMDGYFDFFLIELSPDFLKNAATLTDHGCGDLARIQAQEDQVLRHLALAILPALAQPDAADALFVEQLAVAMGAHLLHRHRGDGATPGDEAHRLGPVAIRQAQELLMAGLGEPASIAEIARTLEMSRNGFFKSFRETVGLSPYQWLLSQRVERARRLLLTTDLPLVEIALTCGFSDQSHFTRIFKRLEGTSPGRWRQRSQ
ncbi:AraC family transcriptional regulator [Salipiger sp. H15]|uniref:AraC family transcriptional regulator n=1 Tax=Alloyangia sp. H15 TaxID=3029062 RepID=A0AAU8ANK4_9RHOB